MAELPSKPDDPMPAPEERRAIRWDAVAAIIATLVGFLALLIAGYTAYIQRYTAQLQREQVRAEVWPYVELGDETSIGRTANPKDFAALVAMNKGVGPAIVHRVEILVNGRPQRDRSGILKALGVEAGSSEVSHSTFVDGTVLSPGDALKFLAVSGGQGAVEFSDGLKGLILRACYASTLGERWIATTDFHTGRFGTREVSSCASIPKADEFHG